VAWFAWIRRLREDTATDVLIIARRGDAGASANIPVSFGDFGNDVNMGDVCVDLNLDKRIAVLVIPFLSICDIDPTLVFPAKKNMFRRFTAQQARRILRTPSQPRFASTSLPKSKPALKQQSPTSSLLRTSESQLRSGQLLKACVHISPLIRHLHASHCELLALNSEEDDGKLKYYPV
jgi:hypothetical protein